MAEAAYHERLAELLVRFGANVQPGQIVGLHSEVGKEELARAIAAAAYRQGAKFVDLTVFDPHLKRARALHADPESLGYVPAWYGERLLALGDERAAIIALTGPVEPDLMDGIDPELVGRDMLPHVREVERLVNDASTNWTVGPAPTPGWAQLVYPDLPADAALEQMWQEVGHICRLDEPDPVAAWNERLDRLIAVSSGLNEMNLDALHFEGPGTDLHVGLLPSSRWTGARLTTVGGIVHVPNLPTEEVFTTPDPERTSGHVTSTKPLLAAEAVITGLKVRFEAGRAVQIDAEKNGETLRSLAGRDPGGVRLGEVALVDRESRIGRLERVFYETLLDENAASHIALGGGFDMAVTDEGDRERVNRSEIHIDFMIGSDDVAVTGIAADGREIPLLRDGIWQF